MVQKSATVNSTAISVVGIKNIIPLQHDGKTFLLLQQQQKPQK
jgi:hypothetical protein